MSYTYKYKGYFLIEGNETSRTEIEFSIDGNEPTSEEEDQALDREILKHIDADIDLVETIDNRKYKGIYGGEYKTKDEAFEAEVKILLGKKLPEVSELCDFYDEYKVLWRTSKHFEDFKLNKKH